MENKSDTKNKKNNIVSVLWKNVFFILFLAVLFVLAWFFVGFDSPENELMFFSIAGFVVFFCMSALVIKNSVVAAKTLEKVKEEKKQTELIVSNLVVGVVRYDVDFKILLINPKAEEMLGVKQKDAIGKRITPDTIKEDINYESLVFMMYPALAPEGFKRIPVTREDIKVMEMKIQRPYDIEIQVVTVSLLDSQKRTKGYLKIIRDVSRENAISKTKSEFISIAAHQLRTPLSATKWIFRMLLDGDVGDVSGEQRELLQKGYDSNERIIGLVNDMLSVARIEEGRFGYDFESLDIVDLVEKTISTYYAKAEEKDLKIIFDKPEEMLNPIKADPTKVGLAVGNLIDNALKYSREGRDITVRLEKLKDYIQISVKDGGVGIPKDQVDRLFHKFFRGSNVIKMQTEGTGLGLFITRNIIVRHGGSIWVETKEGEGTTFFFTLPAKAALIPKKGTNITHSSGF